MNKALILILALLLLTGILAAKSYNSSELLSSSRNPELFQTLNEQALKNIELLPKKQQKHYRNLLKHNPDLLMNFLLAYEYSAALAEADSRDVKKNYDSIKDLVTREGIKYPLEFFFSYIAKQTVSDERITAYRKILWDDGLGKIYESTPDIIERYRKVSLWCVERLMFKQTSGRDQSPLDITQKSLIGRCEEMQILFVAAARVVGIPARPASTPWWAHTDNNHAWAEVYLDGKWDYTGDMDAAYYPNQTWFSALVDKTVLILADGSLPADTDEVLLRGSYEAVINSTPNYAKERTRTLKLEIVDEDGNPVPKTQISILVYNWGGLRPLITLPADESGSRSLSVGRGAFFVSAFSETAGKAMVYIESSDAAQLYRKITLEKNYLPDQSVIMHYPALDFEWKQAPEEWNSGAKKAKAIWQEGIDSFTSSPLPAYVSSTDTLFKQLWIATRFNQAELSAFGKKYYPLQTGFMEFLLADDEKFLWQASRKQFAAVYLHYKKWAPGLAALEDRERHAVLSPSVHYEELPVPKSCLFFAPRLYSKALQVKGKTALQKIQNCLAQLAKEHPIDPQHSLVGLLRMDLAIKQKHLQSYQFKVLAVSALRANGIPSEYTRVPDVINVWLEGSWQYYNVVKNALEDKSDIGPLQTRSLSLKLQDQFNAPLKVPLDKIALSIYRNGQLYPINQSFEYLGDGSYQGEFPMLDYYLQIGYRIDENNTGYQIIPIRMTQEDPLHLHLELPDYPQAWNELEPQLKPLVEEQEGSGFRIIVVGNYSQENSIRIMDKLKELGKDALLLGYDDAQRLAFPYAVSRFWRDRVSHNRGQALRTLTLIRGEDGSWQMYEGLWDKLPE